MSTKPSPLPKARLTVREGRIDYPTLVFLHGVYHGSWAFEEFSQTFSQAGYPVAFIDMPGHWGSSD